jgi:hypothetical protein
MRLPSRGSDSEKGFGGQPMALRRAFGAAFLEPQEIGKLTDAIVAISHCRPRLELAARAASRRLWSRGDAGAVSCGIVGIAGGGRAAVWLRPLVGPLPASFVDTAPLVGPLPGSAFGCANAGTDRPRAMTHASKLLPNDEDMSTSTRFDCGARVSFCQ